jgi:hypothetical protein
MYKLMASGDGAGRSRKKFAMPMAGLAVALAIPAWPGAPAEAKTPGTVHCYGGWCHRINSIDEMDSMVGRRGFVTASFYDDCKRDRFNPCGLTSSGAVFRPDLPDNAASPIFPDGTVLLTYNPETKLAAVLRVTSTGPYRGDRTLDVSRATAEHLGFAPRGVASLEVVVLKSPEEHEARYVKLRTYEPVPGFIGRFDSFEAAHDKAMSALRMETGGVVAAATDVRLDVERWLPRGLAQDLIDKSPIEYVAASGSAAAEVADAGVLDVATLGAAEHIQASELAGTPLEVAEVEAPPAFIARLAAMIDHAQFMARLDRAGPALVALENDAGLSLIERVKSFIRAAQVRARLSVTSSQAEL